MDTQTQKVELYVPDGYEILHVLRRLMALLVKDAMKHDATDQQFMEVLFHPSGSDIKEAPGIIYNRFRAVLDTEHADTHIGGMVYGYFCMADALVKRAASEPTFEALMDEVAVQMWTYNPAQAKALGLPEPNPGNGTEDGLPFATP